MSDTTTFGPSEAQDIIDIAQDFIDNYKVDMEAAVKPYGVMELKNDLFLPWIEGEIAKSPMVWGLDPQGQPIGPIPAYILVLENVEGGDEILERYMKLAAPPSPISPHPPEGMGASYPPAVINGGQQMQQPGGRGVSGSHTPVPLGAGQLGGGVPSMAPPPGAAPMPGGVAGQGAILSAAGFGDQLQRIIGGTP